MSSYAELQQQIAELQQQAAALLSAERAAAIASARAQIAQYHLTARDLGLAVGSASVAARGKPSQGAKAARPARYRGPQGQTWSGIGRQPRWFREALAAGQDLSELRID